MFADVCYQSGMNIQRLKNILSIVYGVCDLNITTYSALKHINTNLY